MNRTIAFPALFLALPLLLAPWLYGADQGRVDLPISPPEGETGGERLLLLKNGSLLRGKIAKLEQHYRVEKSNSEMLVPAAQVEMVCRDLDEVYQRRRLERTGTSADSHIELAKWCMRQGLLEYAARELLDARAIDGEHRQLSSVERQLQLLLKHQEAASEKESAPKTVAAPNAQEQQAIEKVPLWAKKLFVRQIQPLVIDSCATSGCHHVDSKENFQLNRLAMEGSGHPGTTSRNLAAILQQLDWQNPEESALLVHARQAHGSQGTLPPAAMERRKYHMLLTWVEQLAIAKKSAPVDEIELVQYEEEGAVDALPLIREAIEEEQRPVSDPFDPAAFNRQHSVAVP